METNNHNITPEGNFTLAYSPYNLNSKPQTALEEAIQYLFDCLPNTEEEILQNIQRYHHHCRPLTRKKKQQLKAFINNVLLPACEEGNQDAIYWAFVAYDLGLGVEQDTNMALAYLKKLAEYDYPDMQCEVGKYCETYDWGERVREMHREAVKWFTRAAKQGNVEAMCCLGECYEYTYGVRRSFRKAFLWMKRAAVRGYEEAFSKLGFYYERGVGVKKDLATAAEWYDKAGWHDKAERLRNGEDLWKMDEDGFSVNMPTLSLNQDNLF